MVQVLYFLLATSFSIALSVESKRTVKWIYRPCGPQMCRELCSDPNYSFIYNTENLACHRFLKSKYSKQDLHSHREIFSCTYPKDMKNTPTGRYDITGINICGMHSGDDYLYKNIHKLTGDTSFGDQTLVEDFGNMTLHQACSKGILCVAEYILSQRIENINSRGWQGMTPVMVAAWNGHKDVFDYLVRQGCDLLAVDDKGDNVLHKACIGGHVYLVNHVISLDKVDIESRGQFGRTPVLRAAIYNHREVFDLLVSKGCNLKVIDAYDNNLLHLMCTHSSVVMIKYIMSLNILSIDSRGNLGWTPVMFAASYGRRELFDLLVSKGCDLSVLDKMKNNILHITCMHGHVSLVKHLMTLEDVSGMYNVENMLGLTPEQMAEKKGHKAVVRFLKMYNLQQRH